MNNVTWCIIKLNYQHFPVFCFHFLFICFSRNHEQTSSRIHGLNLASVRKSFEQLNNFAHKIFTTKVRHLFSFHLMFFFFLIAFKQHNLLWLCSVLLNDNFISWLTRNNLRWDTVQGRFTKIIRIILRNEVPFIKQRVLNNFTSLLFSSYLMQ